MISVFNFLTSVKSSLYICKHFKLCHPVASDAFAMVCVITTNEKPMHRKPVSSPCSLQPEKARTQQQRPSATSKKQFKTFF